MERVEEPKEAVGDGSTDEVKPLAPDTSIQPSPVEGNANRGWSRRRKKDLDEPKPGLPKGALLVIIVPSLLFMFFDVPIEMNGVPLPLAVIGHGLPILCILLMGNHIRKVPLHTRRDKRRLWLFFLGCYIVASAVLSITHGGQGIVVVGETESMDTWIIGTGIYVLWIALPMMFIGLAIFLVLLSGWAPWDRPVQYAGVFIGLSLFCILLVPYVNQNLASWEGADLMGWPVFDPIPPPGDEVRVMGLTSYLHGSYVESEYGGVIHDDFGDANLLLQLGMGIMVMIFASLWSLFKPETYRSTFGLADVDEDLDHDEVDASASGPGTAEGTVEQAPDDV